MQIAWILAAVFALIALGLAVRIALLYRALNEICDEMDAILREDTNTLITVSSGDRRVRCAAARMNGHLRALRAARHELRRGKLSLKENVTGISHDLRTPLTAICGYLDLLEREEMGEAARRYAGIIGGRVQALKNLTEELFRYTIADAQPEVTKLEAVDLAGALEEAVIAQFSALTERGIQPRISLPERPVVRMLSRAGISRVFGNILSNAIKYSDGDLTIEMTEAGVLRFSNAASGLDEVQVGKLFDRFYTVENAREATGLGLSIARALTERMGGRIDAAYHDGRLELTLDFSGGEREME